jgi:lysozyme family protein
MANFNTSYDKLLKHEGGYSNDSVDRGGETYKGIARNFHSYWEGWAIIDNMKGGNTFPDNLKDNNDLDLLVRDFYKKAFWDKLYGDEVHNQAIADELFDIGVNMGVSKAVNFLQIGLNCLNRNGRDYPNISEDGKLGPITLDTLNIYLEKNRIDYLYKAINILQGMHYINIMKGNESQERFARGWLKRVTFIKT